MNTLLILAYNEESNIKETITLSEKHFDKIVVVNDKSKDNLKIIKESPFIKKLKSKISDSEISAYFVHSYNFNTDRKENKVMSTSYGQEITAMVSKKNIIGVQFHPEKSHKFGLIFLETFIENEEF